MDDINLVKNTKIDIFNVLVSALRNFNPFDWSSLVFPPGVFFFFLRFVPRMFSIDDTNVSIV